MLVKEVGFIQLSNRAGFSQGSLTNWLSDKIMPTTRNIAKIAEVLGVKPEDLYRSPYEIINPEPKPHNKLVPMLGIAACGLPVESWDENALKYIDAGDTKGLVTPFLLEARGKSMFPMIYEKDKLLCSHIERSQLIDEMLVVVSYRDIPESSPANAKLITVKKTSCILYSINANYKPIEVAFHDIQKIYKVVRIIRDIK